MGMFAPQHLPLRSNGQRMRANAGIIRDSLPVTAKALPENGKFDPLEPAASPGLLFASES